MSDNTVPDKPEDFDEQEFIPCSRCDGHPACEDFGCAYELGLGRLVKNNLQDSHDKNTYE